MELKPKYVTNLQGCSTPPNEDEWSDIYDANAALLEKLGKLTWQDRNIAFKEYYSDLIDALNARGTKQPSPPL